MKNEFPMQRGLLWCTGVLASILARARRRGKDAVGAGAVAITPLDGAAGRKVPIRARHCGSTRRAAAYRETAAPAPSHGTCVT